MLDYHDKILIKSHGIFGKSSVSITISTLYFETCFREPVLLLVKFASLQCGLLAAMMNKGLSFTKITPLMWPQFLGKYGDLIRKVSVLKH